MLLPRGMSRRQFLKAGMVVGGSLVLGGSLLSACSVGSRGDSKKVKVGLLIPLSGVASIFGPPTENAARLAADEINAAGGILGRQIELVVADDGTDARKGNAEMNRLANQERVDVVFGQHSSATRVAAKPVAEKAGISYWYTPIFEGQECDARMVYLGEVPSQQLAPMIPFLMQQYGKGNWYLVGNDYNWGQISVAHAKEIIAGAGGTVVGTDMSPLGTADYSAIVKRIADRKPGLVYAALVGADAVTFNKQMYDFGLRKDVITLGGLLEEMTAAGIGAQAAAGLWSAMAYWHSLDTPANKQFLAAYRKKFGDKAPVQTSLSEGVYTALHLFAKAAAKAGTLDRDAIIKAVVGVDHEAPRGRVKIADNHYCVQHIYAAQVGADGVPKVQHDFGAIDPREKC